MSVGEDGWVARSGLSASSVCAAAGCFTVSLSDWDAVNGEFVSLHLFTCVDTVC